MVRAWRTRVPGAAAVVLAGAVAWLVVPAALGAVDLHVESVLHAAPPPGPVVGETFPVKVALVNEGDEPSPAFSLALWTDRSTAPAGSQDADAVRTVGPLPPGSNNGVTLEFEVTYDEPGTFTLWAVADPDGQVVESSDAADPRQNNAYTALLAVSDSLADLIIENLAPAEEPVAGRPFRLDVTIRNQGRTPTGVFRVGLWKDRATAPTEAGNQDQEVRVPALPAAQSAVLSFDVVYDAEGSHTIWAMVDMYGNVTEINEDNNAGGEYVTVAPAGGCLRGTTSDLLPIVAMGVMLGFVRIRRWTCARRH